MSTPTPLIDPGPILDQLFLPLIVISSILGLSAHFVMKLRNAIGPAESDKHRNTAMFGPFGEKEKPKNDQMGFDPFADNDESPTYMTVGDDGELVEVDRG